MQTSLILKLRSPKPYELLKFFMRFRTNGKSCHGRTIWIEVRWKSLLFAYFYEYYRNLKKRLTVYVVLGDTASKLETFVSIFNYIFESIPWSLFDLKASNLDKWSIPTLSFMWWCQCIDGFKFKISPQFPARFRSDSSVNTSSIPSNERTDGVNKFLLYGLFSAILKKNALKTPEVIFSRYGSLRRSY